AAYHRSRLPHRTALASTRHRDLDELLLPFSRRPPSSAVFPYTPLFRSPGPGGASTFGRGLSGETVRGRDGLRHCLEPAHELRGRRAAADGDEGHRPQRFGSALLAG